MPAYVIAQIKVTDDAWIPDYAAKAHEIVHRHGGKYLTRTGSITPLEGEPPDADIVAVIEFPDQAAVEAFGNDADYAPLAEARKAGSDSRFTLLGADDVAGTIDYLPAGG